MTDMKRLLDDSIPPGLADLLRSLETEGPDRADERRRAIVAGMLAVPSASSPKLSRWRLPALTLVLVAGAFLGSALVYSSSRSAPVAPHPIAEAMTPAAEATESPRVEPTVEGVAIEDLPTATVPQPHPPPARALRSESAPRAESAPRVESPSTEAPKKPTLQDELAAIDAARAALAAGRGAEALAGANAYRRTFPEPHFESEATVVEVQALALLGRGAEARQKAAAFLSAHPESPYTQRVQSAAGIKE